MHKTFTRVVTRQFDAHNIDSHFSRFSRIPIVYTYIFRRQVFSIHSVPRERISFFLPSFLYPRIEREKADRIDTSFSPIANNLYQEERDLFVIRKRMPRIVIRPTVEISNRVESLSPRATSGTLYYPDVVPLPTRARNTFSRGYSRAYLITGFNCFRESVLSFLGRPPFSLFQGESSRFDSSEYSKYAFEETSSIHHSSIECYERKGERKKKRAFFLLIYILNSSRGNHCGTSFTS